MCGRWLVAISSTKVRVISSLRTRRYSQRKNKIHCTNEVMANVDECGSSRLRIILSVSKTCTVSPPVLAAIYLRFALPEKRSDAAARAEQSAQSPGGRAG